MEVMSKPKTADEYVKMVRQAVAEVEELRACAEFEAEEEGRHYPFLDQMEAGIKELYQSMVDGTYIFENKDLPFMAVVNRFKNQIPFARLLALINRTHREGLEIGDQ